MKTTGLLDSIGLCFSGGGYRATAFSLGVLSYLNKITYNDDPLLEHVEAISMVSGGSITGAFYADAKYRNEPFDSFYTRMYDFLFDDMLCEDALKKFKDDSIWDSSHKKRSLINAFALTYKDYLGLHTFGDLDPGNTTSLKDVCVNAIELAYGLTFRFQNNGIFGIEPQQPDYLQNLRGQFEISDAIASSTCFPGVFEPMVLPDDYISNKNQPDYIYLKQEVKYKEGIGIMDGGIVDNQGIGSMIKIDRLRENNPLDAFIICDVDSYQMDQWIQSKEEQNEGRSRWSINYFISKFITPLKLNWYHRVIPLLGVGLICLAQLKFIGDLLSSGLSVLGGILLGTGILIYIVGRFFSKLFVEIGLFVKELYHKKMPEKFLDEIIALKTLELGTVKRLISERWKSTLSVVSDVFPIQIRRLNYRLLHRSAYKDKSISVRVYQLNGQKTLGESFVPNPDIEPPSELIIQSALIASQTPLTLWWDVLDREVDRLDNLIACGQFTTCYNLLDYMIKNHVGPTDKLRKQLTNDWKVFLGDPFFLLEANRLIT